MSSYIYTQVQSTRLFPCISLPVKFDLAVAMQSIRGFHTVQSVLKQTMHAALQ